MDGFNGVVGLNQNHLLEFATLHLCFVSVTHALIDELKLSLLFPNDLLFILLLNLTLHSLFTLFLQICLNDLVYT